MWIQNLISPLRFSTICDVADKNPVLCRALRPGLLGLLVVGGALLSASVASAQKVAYVASTAIFERLPQAVEARNKLAEMQGKWTREIREMENQAMVLRSDIDRNRLLWSEQERNQKTGELRDVEAKLADFRSKKFGPNGEFETQYQQLMAPVIEIVSLAITAEAEAQEYDFVFDKSSRGLPMLFANPDYDLTYAVLKRLGVEVDPSELQEREKKPMQLLPSSLPINIGDGGINAAARLDPSVSVPAGNGQLNLEMQQSAKVEANPNLLLNPAPEQKEKETEP